MDWSAYSGHIMTLNKQATGILTMGTHIVTNVGVMYTFSYCLLRNAFSHLHAFVKKENKSPFPNKHPLSNKCPPLRYRAAPWAETQIIMVVPSQSCQLNRK